MRDTAEWCHEGGFGFRVVNSGPQPYASPVRSLGKPTQNEIHDSLANCLSMQEPPAIQRLPLQRGRNPGGPCDLVARSYHDFNW